MLKPRGRFAKPEPLPPVIQHLDYVTHKGPVYKKTADAPTTPLTLPSAMRARFEKREAPFVPSDQQQALFDWIQNGQGNAILLAAAGCGKTTTLIQALRFMEGSIFFGAYNKSAADDILAKAKATHSLQKGLRISTVHAAGYGDFMRAFPRTVVDDRKVSKIIAEFMEIHPQRSQIEMCRTFIARMVSFGKQFLIGCRGKPDATHLPVWLGIADHFSVDQDLTDDISIEQALQWTIEVFEKSRVQCAKGLIDFDDMIYAPIAYGVRLWPNDWVLIDEAQDINPARRELAKRLLKAGGRAIFVGDDRQSVYGFTGAGGDSIERIREEFNCTTLPLSITYRCPKSVVEYVHQYVGPEHIQAHETAPEGVVRPINYEVTRKCPVCSGTGQREESDGRITTCEECAGNKTIGGEPWFQQDAPEQKDVILCRYTRPLIQTAYALIKDGVACKVEGRDIGLGLISLARMWKITSLTRLAERLDIYLKRELEKAAKSESDRRAQEVTDKVATLRIFIERCQSQGKTTIVELVAEIESMFQDNVADVLTLATGHKAKGREWDRVFWIRTNQRGPSKKPWEDVQEINIQYVIATRAKSELIFVPENLK